MAENSDEEVSLAAQQIGTTIIQLKKVLEEILVMRVECAKLEIDMLTLYHTICPEELEGLCDEPENVQISENMEAQAS